MILIEVLKKNGASQIIPLAFVRMTGDDHDSYEREIDFTVLKQFGINPLVAVLNDRESIYTTRVINYALTLDKTSFHKLNEQLTTRARLNLYLFAIEYFSNNPPSNMDILAEQLKKDNKWTEGYRSG